MLPLKSRLSSLMKVISLKQNVFKAKSKTFSTIISGSRQMKSLKNVNFQFQTIFQLFKHLITINVPQLTTMVVLSFFSLLIRLFCANINTFLIDFFQQSRTASNLIQTILILIVYKLIKNVVDQWSSYLQMNYGFQGYSALYYQFLSNKKQMTGQVLNIIEDDMQKVANLPYSLVNFPFLSILIFVLTALLSSASSENVAAIVLISLFLYVINCIGGLLIFKMNQKIMKQKDYRLSLNLQQSYQSQSENLKARSKQVSMIKYFLMVKVVVKWSLEFIFIFMYAFVFLWTDSQEKQEDQLYYKLTLLGMLKISFNSLFMESYYLALVFNSFKRIILYQNRQSIQSSTIGCFEDFMKKNQKSSRKIDEIKDMRQSTQSSLTSQRSSISHSVLQKDNDKNQKSSIQIKQINKNSCSIQTKKKRYRQRGQIKFFELAKSIYSNSNIFIVIGVIFLAIGTFYLKFETLFISKSIIHNTLSPYQTFIFILPGVLYILFYLLVIFMFVNVSHRLFRNLSSNETIEGQDLNRVSGDIQMVDKYVSPAFYQFLISAFGLLASLVFSVVMIHDGYFMISLAMVLIVIIFISVFSNRYFMKSRRQIKRLQCKTKSKVIQTYTAHSEPGSKFQKIEKYWKLINIYKNLGIIIENSSIFLLNIMVLLIQVIFLIICFAAKVQKSTMKLILVFILQIDFSLTTLFLNAIYLEMGLVNFERCLNFVKEKQKSRKIEIPQDATD